jgi:hypothetical protein
VAVVAPVVVLIVIAARAGRASSFCSVPVQAIALY